MLPFTTEQFLGVFKVYNKAVWPMQPVLFVLGLMAVALALWKRRFSDYIVSTILASLWQWMGVVYNILFFSAINPIAVGFGIVGRVHNFRRNRPGPVGLPVACSMS